MKKLIAWALCLMMLAGAVTAGTAEDRQAVNEAAAAWEARYGDSRLWDYQVNADFAAEHPELWTDPSDRPVLPPDDGETCSAEKAKKLAYKLIPEFGTEVTFETLTSLTCVVSSYRKPEHAGSFWSVNGAWDIQFWNTQGAEPEFVCTVYLDAVCDEADVLVTASGVRYECQYETPDEAVRIDPNGGNSEQGRARLEARIIAEKFGPSYGLREYDAELIEQYGPFPFWTAEQKCHICATLSELEYWERVRLSLYQAGQPWPTDLLGDPILQWSYGDPASVPVTEEEAKQKALDYLKAGYDLDCTGCRAAAALYTGHWYQNPFAEPFWVFSFREGDERKAEVWVNAVTGELPKYRADEAEAVVRERFAEAMAEGYEVDGRQVTEEMVDDVAVFYLEPENEWYGIVAVENSYLEIALDADTLEYLDEERSNG